MDNEIEYLKVNEEYYKPDLEILGKYHSFAAEILRLSLLGLSVFGILLNKDFFKSEIIKPFIIISILSFGLSSAFSLAYRFYSTKGLNYHIRFVRKKVEKIRNSRNWLYWLSVWYLIFAVIFLGIGAISLAIGFIIPKN